MIPIRFFCSYRARSLAVLLGAALTAAIPAVAASQAAAGAYYTVESHLDDLVASWPESPDDLDRTLTALMAITETLYQDYHIEHLDLSQPRAPQSHANPPGTAPNPVTAMPQTPHYFGAQFRSVPGRQAFRHEFFLFSRHHQRVHATRFDEHRTLREFVLVQWSDGGWRALSYRRYPDGAPQNLEWWEDGRPVAFHATWDTTGTPSVVPLGPDSDPPFTVCTVSVSFAPPDAPSEARAPTVFPHVPVAGRYLAPRGASLVIAAPRVARYEFAGWTGAVTSPFARITVTPEAPIHLVSHAAWYSESNNRRNWSESNLHYEIRRVLDKPEGVVSSYDLQDITTLDLSNMQVKAVDEIRLLRNLRELNLANTPVEDLFVLTPYGSIMDALTANTTLEDEGLLNRVLLALHTGMAPPLRRLTLPGHVLPDEADGSYFTNAELIASNTPRPGPPEPLTIDLVDALTQFVETYYPGEDPLRFDQNDYIFIDIKTGKPGPNGMPDAAEFRLLQAILQSPQYDTWDKRAFPFSEGMRIWNANLALGKRLLGDIATEEPFLLHTLCAYITAGEWDQQEAAVFMVNQLKELALRPELFEVGLGRVIRPKESIQTNARFNYELWNSVSRGRELNRGVLDAYADAVMQQLDK